MNLRFFVLVFWGAAFGATATPVVPFYQVQAVDGGFTGNTVANDLNDAGDVVGTASGEDGTWPFVFRNGAFERFGPGSGIGERGTGLAISNSGLIAGRYKDSATATHYDPKNGLQWYSDEGIFFVDGVTVSRPRDLQDFNGYAGGNFVYTVYGFATDSELHGALVRSPSGAFFSYDFSTGAFNGPGGLIERSGNFNGAKLQLTKARSEGSGAIPAGCSVDGTIYKLQDLIDSSSGFIVSEGAQINASGQIAATGRDVEGRDRAILLTPTAWPAKIPTPTPVFVPPTPEPSPGPAPALRFRNGRLSEKCATSNSRYVIKGTSRGARSVQIRFRGKTRLTPIHADGQWSAKISGLRPGTNRVRVVAWNPATKAHSKAGTVIIIRR